MQSFEGIVVSAKTPKTVTVTFDYHLRHPKYKKIIRRTTKVLAHNEKLEIKEGDRVTIVKSRPFSKQKHFIVTGVVKTKTPVKETETKVVKKKVTKKKT